MKILYLSIIFINYIVLIYTYTFKLSGINRVIITTPLSVFESSIPLIMQDEEIGLYYDQDELKKSYENYLDRELRKYTDSYEVTYYFYNTENGGYCDINNCQGVIINIEAKVMFNMTYKREMKYEITESKYYG